MDHLSEVLKEIFPDSQIAQELTLKRTKTKGVITNVIAGEEKTDLVNALKSTKFSILTDESTDISSVKTSCVMVRFYDTQSCRVVSRFWDLTQIFAQKDPGSEEGATGDRVFKKIVESFEKFDIPKEGVIGFGSDGCNVMNGANNSVASRMQEMFPGIILVKCLCHSLHICPSEACKCLPCECEDLAQAVWNYFAHSSKRQAQFTIFQAFFNLELHKMLHPSQTRFLSLVAVVNRMLEQWEPLKLFFSDQSLSLRLNTANTIFQSLNNPFVKGYFLFLKWILPNVTGLNEYFQSEKTVITVVHEKMVSAYKGILLNYMTNVHVLGAPLQDVAPDDKAHFKPLNALYLGTDVAKHLATEGCKARPDLIAVFKDRCRSFLITLCLQIKKRYDLNDPVLSQISKLSPSRALSLAERDATPSLMDLMVLLPRCTSEDQHQLIDDEWRTLPLKSEKIPLDIKNTTEPDVFWHKMLHYKDDCGDNVFTALPKFALTALSLPVANADCERKFSKINNIKTKLRNRLITPTVNGILLADQAVRKNGGCCTEFCPSSGMLSNMTKAVIYNLSATGTAKEGNNALAQGAHSDDTTTDISELFSFDNE